MWDYMIITLKIWKTYMIFYKKIKCQNHPRKGDKKPEQTHNYILDWKDN